MFLSEFEYGLSRDNVSCGGGYEAEDLVGWLAYIQLSRDSDGGDGQT